MITVETKSGRGQAQLDCKVDASNRTLNVDVWWVQCPPKEEMDEFQREMDEFHQLLGKLLLQYALSLGWGDDYTVSVEHKGEE